MKEKKTLENTQKKKRMGSSDLFSIFNLLNEKTQHISNFIVSSKNIKVLMITVISTTSTTTANLTIL